MTEIPDAIKNMTEAEAKEFLVIYHRTLCKFSEALKNLVRVLKLVIE